MFSERSQQVISEHWFAAHTSSCQEKRVVLHLATRNIPFFLPVHRKVSLWRNGVRAAIETPLFPGYVFVKINSADRVRVLELPGVQSLVSAGRQPIPLPYEEIEALRRGMPLLKAEPHPLLRSGDKVRILNGPLQGITGIVLRQKNSTRIVLTLDLIMKSIAVEVDGQDLELVDHVPVPFGFIPAFVDSRERPLP